MRLVILSRKSSLYSTRRFVEVAEQMGHQSVVIDTLNCTLSLGPTGPSVTHNGKNLADTSMVLPRIGNSITEYGLAVVRQFELAGIPTVNSALAINISRDKFRTMQLLAEKGVAVPTTLLLRNLHDLRAAAEALGGFPLVVKKVQGTQGVGVVLADSIASLESYLETLWGLGQHVLVQQYIKESAGTDLRAIVVDGKVVGAMRRQARPGEFRANLHRGGECTMVDLPEAYGRVALQAMEATGLRVGGVDMLETSQGPLVLEVNSSPGFEGIERATGIDIARLILEYAFSLPARGVPT
jgi:ribosomal protein S6--L-glutamate ligase